MRRRSLAAAALALVAGWAPWSAARAIAGGGGYELDPAYAAVRTPVVPGAGVDLVDAFVTPGLARGLVVVARSGSSAAIVRAGAAGGIDGVAAYAGVVPRAAAMASDGSVVLAGDGEPSAAATVVVRVRPDGSVLSRAEEPPVYGAPYVQTTDAVAVLPGGDAVVAGTAAGYLVLHVFGPGGEVRWSVVRPLGEHLRVRSVAARDDGSVVVGGSSGGSALLASLAPGGEVQWTATAGTGEAGDLHVEREDGGGAVVAALSSPAGYSLARFSAGGVHDTSFGGTAAALPAPGRARNLERNAEGFVVSGAGGLAGSGGRSAVAIAGFGRDGKPAGTVQSADAVPLQHERGIAVTGGDGLPLVVGETGNDDPTDQLFAARLRAASPAPPSAPSATTTGASLDGYWMLDAGGTVHELGAVAWHGNAPVAPGGEPAVDVEATPSGRGYWVVDRAGHVSANGDARPFGAASGALTLEGGESVSALEATPEGDGYWLFTSSGRAVARGAAAHLGDMRSVTLNAPVIGAVATADGSGYWMVAADGGIFTFGSARFSGSTGDLHLNAPVEALVPDGDGDGYWLVASDGGVFSFAAPFHGSLGSLPLNRPVTGMVGSPDGSGYLMVAEDGGVFSFGNAPFFGSLGDDPPASPVVAITTA
jgi:hypothetical protein